MTLFITTLILLQVVFSYRSLIEGLCCMLAIRFLIPDAARSFATMSLNSLCSTILLTFLFFSWLGDSGKINKTANNRITHFVLFFCVSSYLVAFLPAMVPTSIQIVSLTQFVQTQLLPAFLTAAIISTERDVKKVLVIVKISFTICIVYGIVCFALKIPYPYNQWFIDSFGYGRQADMERSMQSMIGGISGRIVGTPSADSYSFGMIISTLFATQYCIYTYLKGKWNLVLLVLIGIGVLCTVRRSPILSAIVFLSVLFFSLPSAKKFRYIGYAIGVLIVVAFLVILIPDLSAFGNILRAVFFFWDDEVSAANDVTGSTARLRIYQFNYTLKQIEYSWLFGNGWGATSYKYYQGMYGWESMVFTTLMKTGIWGLCLYGYMFWSIYKYSIEHLKSHAYPLAYIISSIALCILTDTIYMFFIFFGGILIHKLHYLENGNLSKRLLSSN